MLNMKHSIQRVLFLLFLVSALLAARICPAMAQTPSTMGFQGFLTDASGNPLTGTYAMTFALYEASAGGTAAWSEVHGTVAVQKGLYNVILGSQGSPLNISFDRQYHLGVTVGSDDEMTPRIALTSSPYVQNRNPQIYHARSHYQGGMSLDINFTQILDIDEVVYDGAQGVISSDLTTNTFTINKSGYYKVNILAMIRNLTGNNVLDGAFVLFDGNNTPKLKHWFVQNFNRNVTENVEFMANFNQGDIFSIRMYCENGAFCIGCGFANTEIYISPVAN